MGGRYPRVENVGRKHPASGVQINLGEPTIVFLTVNTRDRRPWLAQPLVHECLCEAWRQAQAWLVGYYLLMPDHLHLFCAPRDLTVTLDDWVTYWKRQFKRTINGRVRLLPNPDQKVAGKSDPPQPGEVRVREDSHPPLIGNPADFRWQEGKPWDTRLRRAENYQQKWQYVSENPVRKGLVENPDDWPYQGMLNVLPW